MMTQKIFTSISIIRWHWELIKLKLIVVLCWHVNHHLLLLSIVHFQATFTGVSYTLLVQETSHGRIGLHCDHGVGGWYIQSVREFTLDTSSRLRKLPDLVAFLLKVLF